MEGRILKNVEGPIGDLWRWHALEELEHKSVAFDVYSQIGGSYKLRKTIMRISMVTRLKDFLTVALNWPPLATCYAINVKHLSDSLP